ncbi:unnamed protein product, partial [Echinostoma caproni]|uniref:15-hydroxyprostaglandin dehydrogenase n=1 Tax=Echinostoma caproni TaxID=27848 RepID=A0A183BCN6_9TREM
MDHSKDGDVTALFERIRGEQNGRLDIVVNCAFSGIQFLLRNRDRGCHQITECSPGEAWDRVNNVGLRNNYVCTIYAIRLMLDWQKDLAMANNSVDPASAPRPGIIINMSSPGAVMYMFN